MEFLVEQSGTFNRVVSIEAPSESEAVKLVGSGDYTVVHVAEHVATNSIQKVQEEGADEPSDEHVEEVKAKAKEVAK